MSLIKAAAVSIHHALHRPRIPPRMLLPVPQLPHARFRVVLLISTRGCHALGCGSINWDDARLTRWTCPELESAGLSWSLLARTRWRTFVELQYLKQKTRLVDQLTGQPDRPIQADIPPIRVCFASRLFRQPQTTQTARSKAGSRKQETGKAGNETALKRKTTIRKAKNKTFKTRENLLIKQ